jgi:hypothetical protein
LAARSTEPDDDGTMTGAGPRPASGPSEFRGSLLFVLGVDLVVLLTWLAWSRRTTASAALVVVAAIVPLGIVALLRPGIRRTAALLIRRERHRVAVVIPVAVSVVLSALALSVGDDARRLPLDSAVRHLGPIDELIVSPDVGSRNQAVDAITRAGENDPRVKTSIDDLLPLVAVDGALSIGSRQIPVTAVELDVPVAAGFGKVPSDGGLAGFTPLLVGDVGVPAALVANVGDGRVPIRLAIGDKTIDVRARPLPSGRGFGALDLAGLGQPQLGGRAAAPVVYVAPGTVATAIDTMADGGASVNARFLVAVSNLGDARRGLRRSGSTTALLESILAEPPAGPTSVPADDPLGLGGTTPSVPAAINATVVAVKEAHVARVAAEFAATNLARRVARGALFAAAAGLLFASMVVRRRANRDRLHVLRSLGLRGRGGAALRSTLAFSGLLLGVPLGVVGAVGAIAAVPRFGHLTTSTSSWAANLARAAALPVVAALLVVAGTVVAGLMPRSLRSRMNGLGLVRLPAPMIGLVGLVVAVAGIAVGRQTTEVGIGVGALVTVIGLAIALGATLLPRRPFGTRTTARPVRRSRTRSFAGVCAATGLSVLPVAAAQRLPAATVPATTSSVRSVVNVRNEVDATGLMRELVGQTGGRVLRSAEVLVAGSSSSSLPVTMVAAGDGLGDAWMPGSGGGTRPNDLPPGTVIVSRQLGAVRGSRVAIGDRLVLVDPVTGRSVSVVVRDLAAFPRWAGDVAVPAEIFAGLRTEALAAVSHSAIALSTQSSSEVRSALTTLSPTVTAQIDGIDASADTPVTAAFRPWLLRTALIMVVLLFVSALAMRSSGWRHVRWTVVLVAALIGSLLGGVFGGIRMMTPIGPLAWTVALGALSACGALALVSAKKRVGSKVVVPAPAPKADVGEFV